MQGVMRAQILKFAGCLMWTQLWSAEAGHKNDEQGWLYINCNIVGQGLVVHVAPYWS